MHGLKNVGKHYNSVWLGSSGAGFWNCKEVSPGGALSLQ